MYSFAILFVVLFADPLVNSIPLNIFDIPTNLDEVEILIGHGAYILGNMNQSVDPCESFYEYACGNWKNNELVPANARNRSFATAIQQQIDDTFSKFLQNSSNYSNNISEIKIKKFYASCLVANHSFFQQGFNDISQFIEKPNQKDTNQTLDWIYINFYTNLGIYPLLPFYVKINYSTLNYDIVIEPPIAMLSDIDLKNFTKDTKIEDEKMFDEINKDFEEVQQFEKMLTFYNKTRSSGKEIRTLKDFLETHKEDKINWTRYFDIAFNGSAKDTWTVKNNVKYINQLGVMLDKMDPSILLRYVKWRIVIEFYKIWKNEDKTESIETVCIEHVRNYFPYTVTTWSVKELFDSKRRSDILEIGKSIIKVFNNLIDQSEWLDSSTKSAAKTKLNAMDISIGYTDDMKHSTANRIYENVSISENFWKNLINLENDASIRLKRKVGSTENPQFQGITQKVNAHYVDTSNRIHFPIGIAQMPMYHLKFPFSLKFGAIGAIVGHEVSHGFDVNTYQLDHMGYDTNWWSNQSLENFQERYRCLEAQYNKFIFDGFRTNEIFTLSENMADNIGVRLAYNAYLRELENSTERDLKPLPNVNFNNKQLFFLKFAQTYCSGEDTNKILKFMKEDNHVYGKFRVDGSLMNMAEFSEVFQCELGSEMNPLRKCVIW